jgi:hypothetical protein
MYVVCVWCSCMCVCAWCVRVLCMSVCVYVCVYVCVSPTGAPLSTDSPGQAVSCCEFISKHCYDAQTGKVPPPCSLFISSSLSSSLSLSLALSSVSLLAASPFLIRRALERKEEKGRQN